MHLSSLFALNSVGSDELSMPKSIKVYGNHAKFEPRAVLRDFHQGLKHRALFVEFATIEIQDRYRRSVLGLSWIVLSFLMFVAAIALFFGNFAQMPSVDFILYVALGYAGYQYIVGNITDGCEVFRTSAVWIKSTPLPYSVHVYIKIVRSVFPFVLHLIAALVVMAFMGWRPSWTALYVIPALAVFLLVSPAIQMFFGLVATRWSDISHLMTAVTRMLFFLTPVIWVYDEQSGLRYYVATFNPLTHFLEVFRAPLLGQPFATESWLYVLCSTALIWFAAVMAGAFMRRRIPFWL